MATPLRFSDSLRDRWMRLSPRERFLIGGAGVAALLLLFVLWMRGGNGDAVEDAGVELATAPPAIAPVLAPPVAAPTTSATDVSSIVLHGILARSAIIGTADGAQRTIPIGREFMTGVTLKSAAVDHVVLATASGDMRLDLKRFGGPAPIAAAPVPADGAGGGAVDHGRETLQFRLGLDPVRSGGRTIGHAIQPGKPVPHLDRAGLEPGDVITSVNGSVLDEERLLELSWQIANSDRIELSYVRDGQRRTGTITNQ